MEPIIDQFLNYLNGIGYYPVTLGVVMSILILIILLLISGLLSGTEAAYFSLSPSEIDKIERNSHKADNYALKNIEDSEKLLASVLIG
ncbi:MAG: DUF21 domain-containing protein, partial [Bacteroidales bacterium]